MSKLRNNGGAFSVESDAESSLPGARVASESSLQPTSCVAAPTSASWLTNRTSCGRRNWSSGRSRPDVWSYACDIAVLDEVRAMARAYRERFDAPEVLINNAGYAVYYTFEQMPSEEIHRLFDVNLIGAALVTRELLPDMIRTGGGRVVMMASIAGRIPMTPCGVYSASKHGLVALAELLQVETARFNIKSSRRLSGPRRD